MRLASFRFCLRLASFRDHNRRWTTSQFLRPRLRYLPVMPANAEVSVPIPTQSRVHARGCRRGAVQKPFLVFGPPPRSTRQLMRRTQHTRHQVGTGDCVRQSSSSELFEAATAPCQLVQWLTVERSQCDRLETRSSNFKLVVSCETSLFIFPNVFAHSPQVSWTEHVIVEP